jgi:imidazolonepropionase-like amidohydrolase
MIYNGTSYVSERMPVLRQNLKQLFAAGVPIVAGTDTGFPGVIAGVSSLMEPVLHVQAGLSPQAALQAATINAARMVNREKEMGTVEAGKLADLLLLDDRQVKSDQGTNAWFATLSSFGCPPNIYWTRTAYDNKLPANKLLECATV